MESLVEQRFMKKAHHDVLVVAKSPRELLNQLWNRETPIEGKWLEDTPSKV